MRVTNARMQQSLTRLLGRASSRMMDLQRQLATGKRLEKPSDDPTGIMRSLGLRKLGFENKQYQRNITDALEWNQATEESLNVINEVLIRMKELATEGATDTLVEGQAIGDQVNELFKEIYAHSKDRVGDRYLFSGFRTSAQPYQSSTSVLGEAFSIAALGDSVALANARIASGSVNVKDVGTGTILTEGVDYDIDYSTGSITPLPTGSMLVGTAYSIDYETEDISSVTRPAAISGEMLRQVGPDQQIIVNLTGPEVFEGGVDLFQLGIDLRNALWKNDTAAVSSLVDSIDAALSHVQQTIGVVGARTSSLNQQQNFIERHDIRLQGLLAEVEDADLTETLIRLQSEQGAYEAALQTASRLLQIDILDFL